MKGKWLTVLGFIGLLFMSFSGHAQSVLDVYRKAMAQDSQYSAARRALQASLEKLPQAQAGYLPTVNVTANSNQQLGEASFSAAPYVARDVRTWNWTLQITQPIVRMGHWAATRQAGAQVTQATEQFALVEQELILRTAQVYLDVQLALQSVQVAKAQLRAISEQLTVAQRTYQVGMGTITDVQEARAKQALSLAQRATARQDLAAKQAELEKLIGEFSVLSPMQFPPNLPLTDSIPLDDWLLVASQGNPQVRIQQAALAVATHEVSKNRAAHAPTLDLVANRAGIYSSGSLSSPADLSTQTQSHQIGLQLMIPLFSGGATQSKVRESLALEEKARDELTGAQRSARSLVRQAFAGVENGHAQVKALQAAVDASENAVESNKIGFRVGTRINPDVLNAEQQLFAALRDLNKARAETVMQSFKLKAAAGSLTGDDLIALNAWMLPVLKPQTQPTASP